MSLILGINELLAFQAIPHLINGFIALLTFIFLFIAVESFPHISDELPNDMSLSSLPTLTSVVLLFSYLVIVPSFANGTLNLNNNIAYFQLTAAILLFIRVLLIALSTNSSEWKKLYVILVIACIGLFIEGASSAKLFSLQSATNTHLTATGTLLAVAALLCALSRLSDKNTLPETKFLSSLEGVYTAICTAIFVICHIASFALSSSVLSSELSNHVIVVLWVVLAICYLIYSLFINNRRIKTQSMSLERYQQTYFRQRNELQDLSEQFINSEEKAIVSASNNAILTCSVTGNILSANPAAIQMFQSLEQDLLDTKVSRLFDQEDELHFFFDYQNNLNKLEREDIGITKESIAVRTDGSKLPVQVELQWAQRKLAPVIVITIINLTDRKLAERKALDQKDQFLANISHEFRTPLTIINGLLDQYLLKSSSEEERQDLTTAKKNGLRLVRMVEQLLDLSRVTDNPRLHKGNFKLTTLLKLPIDSFNKLASQNEQTFVHDIAPNLWLTCDAQAFEKIVFNLLSNAFKYTPKGGTVSIIANQINDNIMLEVIDTGIGISDQAQATIFERFQRDDSNKEIATFGVGIGLSLVSELVKAHQWDINLTSAEGHGSKFSVVMPLASPSSEEDNAPASLLAQDVSSLLSNSADNISDKKKENNLVALVIEDNKDMQTHIKQIVEQEFHCIVADDGETGIDLAVNYLPDIIVCDLMLTGIDGFEVLQYLKQHEMTSHIPIVMLTARSDLDTRLTGLSLHADDYMSKPFNYRELLTRMNNLLVNREVLKQAFYSEFKEKIKANRKTESQSNTQQLAESPVIDKTPDEKFLERLEIIIAQHYVDPALDITSLSRLMATSERQLQRKMKMLLGVSPSSYIKEFRLVKAKELLVSGNQVGRIALDVGFSSQTYFGRCFKEAFQCTPKQFQQEHLKQL
ncbi:ATP-binding protein [Thalassotalea marina]|nr:ATP-binding protein [Thalassotalea marina]